MRFDGDTVSDIGLDPGRVYGLFAVDGEGRVVAL